MPNLYLPPLKGPVKGLQSNNRAEGSAILECLKACFGLEKPLHIFTDSEYCIKMISKFCRARSEGYYDTINLDKTPNSDIFDEIAFYFEEYKPLKVFISKILVSQTQTLQYRYRIFHVNF